MIRFRFYLIAILNLFIFVDALASTATIDPSISRAFSKLGVQVSNHVLTDYGKIARSHDYYFQAFPHTTQEVAALLSFAYQHKLPIRIQGKSHSENGNSLPHAAELLIRTDFLNTVKFEKAGEVTAGAGIPMVLLNEYIKQKSGFALPVLNGGGSGPSLGGFISAGGISYDSSKYGGFWNHVQEITLVVAHGKILHVSKNNVLFPWIFGSMGQLGVITEAKLNLIPQINSSSLYYPLHKQDHLPPQHQDFSTKAHKPLYWFNLFVKPDELEEAKLELAKLQKHHPDVLDYIPMYEWSLNHNRFVPPLIFKGANQFYAIGIWGGPGLAFDEKKLASIEKEFDLLVINKHYHRYIQAELAPKSIVYTDYFEPEILLAFSSIKKKLDPEFLFNQGIIFGAQRN